ncbi:LPXTG cell wall anchor domain-containing protein [Aminipila terrae]|uniref:LPXTG cell wall anchor domain-containing protein n=1 Tax=Aminipila terrae TaxID=2697030 RepID=A0A6P1MJN1_9FIRM|nr:LPXTG cell wall anchor domain-containing protein [Aminipila terrae]QHI71836.1 LPXTG cell wall anchor domain-containing protein [Aminipila terrae]
MNELTKKGYGKILAFMLAMMVAFTYSTPISAFAEVKGNSAEIVNGGGDSFYDKNGKSVPDWNSAAVGLSKKITKLSGDNEFQIDLKVQTKSEVQTVTKENDAAVTLVMDVSRSMVDNKDGGKTRLAASKDAAMDFLRTYVKDAGNARRMVSVVMFGTNGKTVSGWVDANGKNDQISDAAKNAINGVNNGFTLQYSKKVEKSFIEWERHTFHRDWWWCTYEGCPDNARHDEYQNGTLGQTHTHEVNQDAQLKDDGGTNFEAGMMLAKNIMADGLKKGGSIDGVAKKSVVVLTDGQPTSAINSSSSSMSYILGTGGSSTNDEDLDEVDGIVSALKGMGSSVYSITYAFDSDSFDLYNNKGYYYTTKNIINWLKNEVGVTENYKASNLSGLLKAFENINDKIDNTVTSNGLKVTDPMGPQYILFMSGDDRDSATFSGNTLVWKPNDGDLVKTDADGGKTYTYSYKIKLDTAAEGFKEDTEYNTNGRTTLDYKYGDEVAFKTVDFSIPSVEGKVPEVPYTIEYYKWDKGAKAFPAEPTKTVDGGKVKLWTVINAPKDYAAEYNSDNYHFAEGSGTLQITASLNGNVIKLYYMPDMANVTVKHYYKTDVINADGSETPAADYVLNNTVPNENLYAGDKFEATPVSELDGVKYTLNAKSDNTVISPLPKGSSTINLYYDGKKDNRKTTSIVVNRIYKTGKWVINETTGRYEEAFDTGTPQKYEDNNDVKAHSTYATSTTNGVKDGYVYEGTDNGSYDAEKNQVTLKLSENENIINETFVKHAEKSELTPAKVVVKHNYYLTEKKIVNGNLVTVIPETPVTVEDKSNDYYVGEHFTPKEQTVNDGITYEADKTNTDKLKTYELSAGTLEINLNYVQTKAPTATTVTVNHIYRTYETVCKEIDNGDGTFTTKKEVVEKEDGRTSEEINKIEISNIEEKLYEGFVYTANKDGEYKGKTYTFNSKDSKNATMTLAASGNVVDLYYDATEDNREAADIQVSHIYITKLTTVEDGKVITKEVLDSTGIVDKDTDVYHGKAGDEFTITLHKDNGGKTYTLRDKDVPEKVTLKPGTNKTIEIVYEREASDLKASALKVIHKYVDKVMTVVDGVAGYYDEGTATVAEVSDFTVNNGQKLPEKVYAGEKYSVDLAPVHDGVTYTPDSKNPVTDITLADSEAGSSLEYKYINEKELPKTSVTVNHHYSYKHIDSLGKESTTTDDTKVEMPAPYVGTNVKVTAAEAGYSFNNVTVGGTDSYTKDAQNDISMTVSNAAVTVDYYYTKTTDNSVKASWKVNHYYRTLDWNDSNDKQYALDDTVTQSGSGYATLTLKGMPNLKPDDKGNATYTLDKANTTAKDGFSEGYTITLSEGQNEINFYYTQKIDSRVATVVKVIHNYYKHDTSGLVPDSAKSATVSGAAVETLPGVLAGSYEEVFTGKEQGAWVGNKFTADKRYTYGEGENQLTYKFKDANPENASIDSLKLASADDSNVVVLNYVYDYDASENVIMKINYVYRTNDTYTGKTTEDIQAVNAKFGNEQFGTWDKTDKTFKAKEMTKSGFTRVTSDKNMTVKYSAGTNEITVVYENNVSSAPSGGGSHKPSNPTNPTNPTNPDVTIPDENVPLTDKVATDGAVIIGDEEVPLANKPDGKDTNTKAILDEKTPLANLPKTGGAGMAGFFGFGAAIMALGAVLRRKAEK